jgi:SAM-dependent methyltransferase
MLETLGREIERSAEAFAADLRRAAARARKEEDVRVAVERALASLTGKLGVTLEGQHEFTLLRGHIDSVYGCVFIEYKNPASPADRLGPTESSPGTRAVVEQIKGRFAEVVRETGATGRWLLGIGCDGRHFVFCRLAEGRVSVEEPVEVSRWSARRFLWALFNLGTRGWALTAEALARDFGHESPLAREGVGAFYKALRASFQIARVDMFLREWKVLFGEVCGYDVENPHGKIRELADAYGQSDAAPAEILFVLHTYYALFMKLLAAHVASSFQRIAASPIAEIDRSPTSEAVRGHLQSLEEGGIFTHLHVTNFLEGDLFSWYLSAWTDEIEKTVRDMVARLGQYNPVTLRDNPREARDLLKQLYHQLFPRSVRHDLGEYYTPDWLAEAVLDRVGYDGNPDTRLLDPACGSGTFLILAIARVRRWLERHFEQAPPPTDIARQVLDNVIGFDLNPLAVLAARTNYLIQLLDLFGMPGRIEIPVYLCDSILTPAEYGEKESGGLLKEPVKVPTSAKLFLVPREVTEDREILARYTQILAEYARAESGFTVENFLGRCRSEGLPVSPAVEEQHRNLFTDIRALDGERRNGVWARFIKNAFAPVFLRSQPVDLVVGNPPWVNWESLPDQYRDAMKPVWQYYGLFSLSGGEGRLGGGKKDLSMLMLYACVDHYLRSGGKLGFVITQSVFKTKGAGDGFRRFKFETPDREVYLRPVSTDDLSDFQPFEGATNRTAIFVCEKCAGAPRYPVPYTIWRKRAGATIHPDMALEQIEQATERSLFGAIPVDPESRTSPWLTAPKATLTGLRKVMGKSGYRAQEGANTGGLNGCYWIRILKRLSNGEILIENLHDVGKIKLPRVQFAIESDLVYPLLRGRDVQRWRATPSAHIILAQDPKTRRGIPEDEMRRRWPKTYSYLKRFEKPLRERSGYRKYFKPTDPFYAMYNVGPYTLARWKVVWTRVGVDITAAVTIAGTARRPVVPIETATMVACDSEQEAHYLAALMNSGPARCLIDSYSSKGTGSFGSPHILTHVAIPSYCGKTIHRQLAELSKRCHRVVLSDTDVLRETEAEIDELAAQLWDISPSELRAIQAALAAMEARPQ